MIKANPKWKHVGTYVDDGFSGTNTEHHPAFQLMMELMIDYALQRIEAYSTERLFETKGNTKGTEFLLQNTLGYANKSDVNSKQELEVTEKQRIKQLPDEEIENRLQRLAPKIIAITSRKDA